MNLTAVGKASSRAGLAGASLVTLVGVVGLTTGHADPSLGLFAFLLGGTTLSAVAFTRLTSGPTGGYGRHAITLLGFAVLIFVGLRIWTLHGATSGELGPLLLRNPSGVVDLAVAGALTLLGGGVATLASGDWRQLDLEPGLVAHAATLALAVAGLLPLSGCGASGTIPAGLDSGQCLDVWFALGLPLALAATFPFVVVSRLRASGWDARAATITGVTGGLTVSIAIQPLQSLLVSITTSLPTPDPAVGDVAFAVVGCLAGATMVGVGLHDWHGRPAGRPLGAIPIALALIAGPAWPLLVGAPVGAVVTDPLFQVPVAVALLVVLAAVRRQHRRARSDAA